MNSTETKIFKWHTHTHTYIYIYIAGKKYQKMLNFSHMKSASTVKSENFVFLNAVVSERSEYS